MNESVVEPFSGMLAAPIAAINTGGDTTVRLAFDVLPVPPCVDTTCTLLFFTPPVVPCTLNETVHDALAASVPADNAPDAEPATAAAVPEHVFAKLLGVATTNPAGRLSVKAMPLNAVREFGFVIVKVSEVVPFSAIVDAPKASAIVAELATVSVNDCEASEPTPL